MKQILLSLFILFSISSSAHSTEYKENPDRFPSIGLNLGYGSDTGTLSATNGFTSEDQSLYEDFRALNIDGRLPISQNLTFNASLAYSVSRAHGDFISIPINLGGFDQKISGYGASVGFRYYFH
jgi:hypothetical protein